LSGEKPSTCRSWFSAGEWVGKKDLSQGAEHREEKKVMLTVIVDLTRISHSFIKKMSVAINITS